MKVLGSILLWLFPFVTHAATDDSFSFTPPLSDVSVTFLGNIFGVVDGVLHGTGSEIMGNMFSILNAAVLALGGIVIMYTLIVGTMNTAHEGEMLGHKWSSIWIPVRATFGLALLLPKASGYCLIQIFVMWVVVQGVGAADRIWNSALSYLNRGGTIVQAQMKSALSTHADSSAIASGAGTMLTGQVCMVGLQQQLENQRAVLNKTKDQALNLCSGTPTGNAAAFCGASVPDFLSTVNFVDAQKQQQNNAPDTPIPVFSVKMPNFTLDSVYSVFNGLCGTMSWNSLSSFAGNGEKENLDAAMGGDGASFLTEDEQSTFRLSRAIALQQMYSDLSMVAHSMVNNDPQLSTSNGSTQSNPYSPTAIEPFGVPLSSSGAPCGNSSEQCTSWGGANTGAALFAGAEFIGAIADYNGVMMPTVRLLEDKESNERKKGLRSFISQAKADGWMTAGGYFFDLVRLNGDALTHSSETDKYTGLDTSSFTTELLTSPFSNTAACGFYCDVFEGSVTKVNAIVALIDGMGLVQKPELSSSTMRPVTTGVGASTTYGYINNASMVQLANQSGSVAPSLLIKMNIAAPKAMLSFPKQNFPCGGKILGWCVGRGLGDIFYNGMIRGFFNIWVVTLNGFFSVIIQTLLYIPLQLMVTIFQNGASIIQQPGVNPIIALASMGTTYINYVVDMWMQFFELTLFFAMVPGFIFLFGLLAPLVMAWMAVMVGIGFLTAYYIPFLPYMIFTFGVIAWLMAVIEAMVAAPIVALGITHPEGEGILGKGEQGLMILMNVFLRPSMMVIGFISGIAMSYVGVWILNVGFQHVAGFMTGKHAESNYISWASLYAGFFAMVMYTMLYLTVVQKSFTLIYALPDKVLRWIGGHPESVGQELAQWGEEAKGQLKTGGEETAKGAGSMSGKLQASADKKKKAIYEEVGKLGGGGGTFGGFGGP